MASTNAPNANNFIIAPRNEEGFIRVLRDSERSDLFNDLEILPALELGDRLRRAEDVSYGVRIVIFDKRAFSARRFAPRRSSP